MRHISIKIEPWFVLLAMGIGWLNTESLVLSLLWVFVIFVSVVCHELGHALSAVAFGQRAHITLMALGGVTQRRGPPLSRWKDFVIVLNGPLAGFLVCFICWGILQAPFVHLSPVLVYSATVGVYINLFWTLVNLSPVLPLDGGKLLMIALEGIWGVKGIKRAHLISTVLSAVIGVAFFLMQAMLAGALFMLFAFESFRGYRATRLLSESDENEKWKDELAEMVRAYDLGELQRAKKGFEELRDKTKEGAIFLASTVRLARILEKEGHVPEGYELLKKQEKNLDLDELCLLQRLAFLSQRWDTTLQVGEKVYREKTDAHVAYLNAMACAKQMKTESALGWFKAAVQEGLENPKAALQDAAFDPIRKDALFKSFEDHFWMRSET